MSISNKNLTAESILISNDSLRIEYNENLGRHIVAQKEIPQGSIILKERATVYGPFGDSEPLCLGCYQPSPQMKCNSCNVAILCRKCYEMENAHNQFECEFLKQTQNLDLKNNYSLVTPLRFILIEKINPELWNKLMLLEDHMERRKTLKIWEDYEDSVVRVLCASGVTNNSNLVQKICGILDVNAFAIRHNLLDSLSGQGSMRGLFLQASFMSHNCISNVHLSQTGPLELTIRASCSIAAGQPIFFNYTFPLKCTEERQKILNHGKYFECKCERCLDPTELGTFLDCLRCRNCKQGYLIRKANVSDEYQCTACTFQMHKHLIKMALLIAKWKLEDAADFPGTQRLEKTLSELKYTLSPHHWLILQWSQQLIERYLIVANAHNCHSIETLINIHEGIINRCQVLIEPLHKLEKGISRLKGIFLKHLASSKIVVSELKFEMNKIKLEELKVDLEEGEKLLREAIKLLIYEPPNSLEGFALRDGIQTLKYVNQQISTLSSQIKN